MNAAEFNKRKIDLSQIRAVSKSRLDRYSCDRLLKEDEYREYFKEGSEKFETIQTKVKKALKQLSNYSLLTYRCDRSTIKL